ncbi:MAG: hypothetical protein U0167_05660 [bacterium]
MNLQRHTSISRPLVTAAVLVLGGVLAFGCRRDNSVAVDRNLPPETFVTQGPSPSPDPQHLTDQFYRAHLYWRGEDRDGTVSGFRFAIDDTTDPGSWKWTTKTDSIFRFQVGEVGSKAHLFLIRAVDNLGKQDASPDTLRFEAFTECPPTVRYVNAQCCYTNDLGTFCGLHSGDTVRVNSTVTFTWTGSDCDGEVVRWESISGAEQPEGHARGDTTRTIGPLTSGKHDFLVRAIDDAGAVSTSGGLFTVFANFDPKCHIDSTSIRSRLRVTWVPANPNSILVTTHDLTQPGVQDTIPFGATVSFCWECEDQDGPVVSYDWTAGFVSARITDPATVCANTDTVCTFDPDSGRVVCRTRPLGTEGNRVSLQVKGRDVYGRVEGHPTTVDLQLNYAPNVIVDPPPVFHANTPVEFTFHGTDLDSDANLLRYRWWFDDDVIGSFVDFQGQPPHTNPRLFPIGTHQFFVQAEDQSGLDRPSPVVRITFDVIP